VEAIFVTPSTGAEPRLVLKSDYIRGLCWLPDGSRLAFASSTGSTVLYPPIFNLRAVRLDGSERQLTFGDVSYLDPDAHSSGKLLASRIRVQSDVWKFPLTASPAENTRAGVRITRQTAQVQTPSVSPDGKQMVYISDSGGHGNLWVANTDGSGVRQITFEREPTTAVGVPV
jgi:TolB protein